MMRSHGLSVEEAKGMRPENGEGKLILAYGSHIDRKISPVIAGKLMDRDRLLRDLLREPAHPHYTDYDGYLLEQTAFTFAAELEAVGMDPDNKEHVFLMAKHLVRESLPVFAENVGGRAILQRIYREVRPMLTAEADRVRDGGTIGWGAPLTDVYLNHINRWDAMLDYRQSTPPYDKLGEASFVQSDWHQRRLDELRSVRKRNTAVVRGIYEELEQHPVNRARLSPRSSDTTERRPWHEYERGLELNLLLWGEEAGDPVRIIRVPETSGEKAHVHHEFYVRESQLPEGIETVVDSP